MKTFVAKHLLNLFNSANLPIRDNFNPKKVEEKENEKVEKENEIHFERNNEKKNKGTKHKRKLGVVGFKPKIPFTDNLDQSKEVNIPVEKY